MCALSHAGDVLSTDKFIWYQGRGLTGIGIWYASLILSSCCARPRLAAGTKAAGSGSSRDSTGSTAPRYGIAILVL